MKRYGPTDDPSVSGTHCGFIIALHAEKRTPVIIVSCCFDFVKLIISACGNLFRQGGGLALS